jgi:cytoskeletal protein RodZ
MMKVHNKPLLKEEELGFTPTAASTPVTNVAKPNRKYVKKAKTVKPEQNFTAAKKVKKSKKSKVSVKLLVVITLLISFLCNLYVVYSIYQAKHSYADTQDTQTVREEKVPNVR